MTDWKAIKNIEKVQPDGVEECGLPKAPYYVIHYEDGTAEEADFIAEHDEEDFADEGDEDFVPRTHEEMLASWDSALHDLKLNLEGKLKFRPIEELLKAKRNSEYLEKIDGAIEQLESGGGMAHELIEDDE